MATHKYAAVIIAWAYGKEIQFKSKSAKTWLDYDGRYQRGATPSFSDTETEWRIKPKIVKREGWVARYRDGSTGSSIYPTRDKSQKVYEHAVDHHRIEWEEEV